MSRLPLPPGTSVGDRLGLGPKRFWESRPDGRINVFVEPPADLGYSMKTVALTQDQFRRMKTWLTDSNVYIQRALPELPPSLREILMSGIGPDDED